MGGEAAARRHLPMVAHNPAFDLGVFAAGVRPPIGYPGGMGPVRLLHGDGVGSPQTLAQMRARGASIVGHFHRGVPVTTVWCKDRRFALYFRGRRVNVAGLSASGLKQTELSRNATRKRWWFRALPVFAVADDAMLEGRRVDAIGVLLEVVCLEHAVELTREFEQSCYGVTIPRGVMSLRTAPGAQFQAGQAFTINRQGHVMPVPEGEHRVFARYVGPGDQPGTMVVMLNTVGQQQTPEEM